MAAKVGREGRRRERHPAGGGVDRNVSPNIDRVGRNEHFRSLANNDLIGMMVMINIDETND